ncbi:MAG: hypothetical protein D6679_11370, partial [Candidatus Hydrogenedentota bacterium]
ITGCTITDHVWLDGGGNNTVESTTIENTGWRGITVRDPDNLIDNVTISGASDYGIYFEGTATTADRNQVLNSVVQNGPLHGIFVDSAHSIVLKKNEILSNGWDGIQFNNARSCTAQFNLVRFNNSAGFRLNSCTNVIIEANEIDSNANYQIVVGAGSNGVTISKNNIYQEPGQKNGIWSPINPLSAIRNYWGTTDSAAILDLVNDGGAGVVYTPWRLGPVDTSPGADTVAPKAPDTVAVTVLGGETIQVTWAIVTADGEPDPNATNLTGYRIYRSKTSDTSYWPLVGTVPAGTESFMDSNLTTGETYYYRVTAYDNVSPFENEAFYSDSIIGDHIDSAAVSISKRIRAVSIGGETSAPLPGATIEYELTIVNSGDAASETAIIRDSVPLNTVFSTASREADTLNATATFSDTYITKGWKLQTATVVNPDQSENSPDYSDGIPADPTTVKWVRWIRRRIPRKTSKTIRFRVIVQ